jgi:hypothetical protein
MTWYLLLSAFCKPLAGFKTTARVRGTVIAYRLALSFLPMTNALIFPVRAVAVFADIAGVFAFYGFGADADDAADSFDGLHQHAVGQRNTTFV